MSGALLISVSGVNDDDDDGGGGGTGGTLYLYIYCNKNLTLFPLRYLGDAYCLDVATFESKDLINRKLVKRKENKHMCSESLFALAAVLFGSIFCLDWMKMDKYSNNAM